MTSSPILRTGGLALALVGSLVVSVPVMAGPMSMDAIPATGAVHLAAMGDLPTVPQRRRGGGRRAKAKDKPYQPLSKDVQGESNEAHKDYLKRNGF